MEPTGSKGKGRAKRSAVKDQYIGASGKEDEDYLRDSDQDGMEDSPVTDAHGRKRPAAEPLDEEVRAQVHNFLERFREPIVQDVLAKRRRLERNISAALNVTNQKLENVWKTQKEQSQDLTTAFSEQLLALLQQWDTDLKEAEEYEVHFMLVLQQQQRILQKCRILQKETQKEMKSLHKQFLKNIEDMKKDCEKFLTQGKNDLRNEMALLLAKLTEDSQKQMLAAIQLFLQSLLLP